MKNLIPLVAACATILSCAPPADDGAGRVTYDTIKSIERTDTGVFVRVTCSVNDIETYSELRRAKSNTATEPCMATAYGYDTLGNRVIAIQSRFDKNKNRFVHVSKEETEYDDMHNPTYSTLYAEKRGNWYPQERSGRTFDTRGNIATLETYEPNETGWTIKTKTFYKYDTQNHITEQTFFRANARGEWSPVEKFQREYDQDLLISEIISGPASGNKWAEKSKAVYEYNISRQCVKTTSYVRKSAKWSNYVKSEYTYDQTGKIMECDTYFWNENTGKWKFHDKETF